MVFVLLKDRSEYIVTLGDAAASFLETPNSTTAKDCLLMRGNKKWERSNQPLFAKQEVESEEGESKYERHAWLPRLQQFNFWIKVVKGSPAIASYLLHVIIVGAFPLFARDYVNAWAWGSASDNILQLGNIRGIAD
ncbi:hypothetical protein BS50DRAFT_634459 [Corynespora cassiicola Philippines]|uniref:Uncharacterized protein n=1 Tax=Corynespora cassiicola Philippines TaxID=1448308 RepID=A0A2T2NNL2_CORCC|nr:hypothetical protein BS50DRAFT_634459 [Corynespora cassiicola Philippines]